MNNWSPDLEIPSIKAELRRRLLICRQSIPADIKAQADGRIIEILSEWLDRHQPEVIGGYLAIAGEVDLMPLYTILIKRDIKFALPFASMRNAPLSYRLWLPGEGLSKDASGMQAPLVDRSEIHPDVVLAPCIGFNSMGYRLGFGGGYFDRTLAQPSRPFALGVAYANSLINFPLENHDIPLNQIITEKIIIKGEQIEK